MINDCVTLLKAAGDFAGRLSWIKLAWEGLLPGKLGMFEALELLTLGITGKHFLRNNGLSLVLAACSRQPSRSPPSSRGHGCEWTNG